MDAIDLVIKEEGFVSYVYKDSLGYDTIGHGICVDKRKGGILEEESLFIVKNRMRLIEKDLDTLIPWWRDLTKARRSVLISMSYQMGTSGLMKFKNTLAAIQEGDYARAAKGMMASLWARQTPGRAKRHADIMLSGRF